MFYEASLTYTGISTDVYTMKVVSVKKGIVEFTTTLNENAIRKKLLAIHEDGIIVQLS